MNFNAIHNTDVQRKMPYNTGFASGGVTHKLEDLCFYSSPVLFDSFVLRNPPHSQEPKRCRLAKKQAETNDYNSELAIFMEVLWIRS